MTLFFVSVFVRKDHIGQTFNVRHDWLSAHTLVTLKVWDKEGIANHKFSSVLTFWNKGDKFDYCLCSLVDHKGNAYYVSYGPFALLLPYAIFKTFGIPFNEFSIGCFGLVVHFFTALFIYLIVLRLTTKKMGDLSIAAIVAFALYVFSPGTLWFHGNVYFGEILTQLIIAALMYVLIIILQTSNAASKKLLWVYSSLCFIGVYTEWLSLFFAFWSGLLFLLLAFKNRFYLWYFCAAAISSSLAIALILVQYSSIAGWAAFKDSALKKFDERNTSEFTTILGNGKSALAQVVEFFKLNFSNVIVFCIIVLLLFLWLAIYKRKWMVTKLQVIVMGCLFLSVLMHHVLFFHFTHDHDFSILKTGLLLIIGLAIMVGHVETFFSNRKMYYLFFAILTIGFTGYKSVNAVQQYYAENERKPDHELFKKIGTVIQKTAKPQEKVFSNAFSCPQLMYYANRNVLNDFTDGGKAEFHNRNTKEPTIFFMVNGDECVYYTRRDANGDSTHVDLVKR